MDRRESAKVLTAKRASYGIDAPTGVRMFVLWGTAGLLFFLAAVFSVFGITGHLQAVLHSAGGSVALGCYSGALLMVLSSMLGKRIQRGRILASIPWRGDEQVLDIGCGRGLLLTGAAARLKTGRAFGIDVWQAQDQSGNKPTATRLNASLEGVGDRVEVISADARSLPFPNNSFDVILSNLCLHNIHGKRKRLSALQEIARVLRPGGRVIISDLAHIGEYAAVLAKSGLTEVKRSAPSFLYLPPVRRVTAKKHR